MFVGRAIAIGVLVFGVAQRRIYRGYLLETVIGVHLVFGRTGYGRASLVAVEDARP